MLATHAERSIAFLGSQSVSRKILSTTLTNWWAGMQRSLPGQSSTKAKLSTRGGRRCRRTDTTRGQIGSSAAKVIVPKDARSIIDSTHGPLWGMAWWLVCWNTFLNLFHFHYFLPGLISFSPSHMSDLSSLYAMRTFIPETKYTALSSELVVLSPSAPPIHQISNQKSRDDCTSI